MRTAGKTPALSCMLQVSRQSTKSASRSGLLVDVFGGQLVHTFHLHLWGSNPPDDAQEKQFDIELSEQEMRALREKINDALDGVDAVNKKVQEQAP